MLATCYKCQKKNEYRDMRSIKEPVFINGKKLYGAFTYTKFFCPIRERKIKDNFLLKNQERILIMDCLNGNQEETRDKPIL